MGCFDLMLMDVASVQAIAGDLTRSAGVVNDSARRVTAAGASFEAGHAGRDYHAEGERVARALATIGAHVFMWANCVHDTGATLQTAAHANRNTDATTATTLNAAKDVLA